MKIIPILCMACNSHILNTDDIRLHFPLSGEMFDPVVPNFYMRPGYLNLDIFCPICTAFPFYPDGTNQGFKGVGRRLKTRKDGKPTELIVGQTKVEAILEEPKPFVMPPPKKPFVPKKVDKRGRHANPWHEGPFPCPECGSGKAWHKQGCSHHPNAMQQPPPEKQKAPEVPEDDPVIAEMVAKVEKKAKDEPINAPPSKEEIAELLADREARADIDKGASLRPAIDQGYQAKVV